MNLNDTGSDFEEFVIHFVLKDLVNNEKKHFAVPVYIFLNNNAVDLYPSILDFGVLYSDSGINHKIPIRVLPEGSDPVRVGFPFMEKDDKFEYDFTPVIKTYGVANPENAYLVGTITLKTQDLKEGDHSGYIIFCKDKMCTNDVGKTRLHYRFTIHKDPLNGKSKMHSFEITSKNTKNKRKSYHIQLLWLKNTFHFPVKIDDITCDDKELSLTYMVSKKFDDLSEENHCCISSLTPERSNCKG